MWHILSTVWNRLQTVWIMIDWLWKKKNRLEMEHGLYSWLESRLSWTTGFISYKNIVVRIFVSDLWLIISNFNCCSNTNRCLKITFCGSLAIVQVSATWATKLVVGSQWYSCRESASRTKYPGICLWDFATQILLVRDSPIN